MSMPIGDSLFRLGILVMAAVLLLFLCFLAVYFLRKRRLRLRLEQEYGKKRR